MEEEQYDQLATGPWPSWNDDSLNEDPWNDNSNIFEDSCISADYSFPLTPDFSGSSQFLTPTSQIDSSALGSAPKSTDYVAQLGPPRFETPSMTNVISPLSSGGTTWTSPSLEFGFNSPVIDTPWSQFGAVHDRMAHVGDNLSSNATTISPMDTVQQSPTQPAPKNNDCRPSAMQDRPRDIRTREWRKIIKPEECPACPKGHTYREDLNRHILVHHRHLAAEYGLSTERPVCKWCNESFARKDHLTRHLRRRHGLEKHAKRRRKGGGWDGT
jgi:transposase-like protein